MAPSSRQSSFHLANQLLDVIRDARLEPGHHLREQQLADLIGVSRTPIRSALNLLAKRGIVQTRKNHGYFLRKPFDLLHRIEIEVPSSADEKLYQRLVRDRLANVVPNSMTQSEIARRYGVDRVALTRTLSRLAEDGLIAKNRGHGWTFLPTLDSLVSLRGSYEFRAFVSHLASRHRHRQRCATVRDRRGVSRNVRRVLRQRLLRSGDPAPKPAEAPVGIRQLLQQPTRPGLVPRARRDYRGDRNGGFRPGLRQNAPAP